MENESVKLHNQDQLKRVARLTQSQLGWEPDAISIQYQASGLTNSNYAVSCGTERVVVRIGGTGSSQLGINRYAEQAALRALEGQAIAPELLFFEPEQGHMITRFIEGHPLQNADLTAHLEEVTDLLRRVHALPDTGFEFAPYRDIEFRIGLAQEMSLPLPPLLDQYVVKLNRIRLEREQRAPNERGLCHNDPFANNFMNDGKLRLLDWEYAGMGDVMFDLACLGCDFTLEQKERLLIAYFGADEGVAHASALEDVIFVVRFWNAMWATLQSSQPHSSTDYSGISEYLFKSLEI